MNLFVLDRMPEIAAQYNCDAHVRKIILEATEMMGCAYDDGYFAPWPWVSKSKFVNHPMTIWVRESRQNFDWTIQHAYALCDEFEYRFGKRHKCRDYIDWIAMNIPIDNLENSGRTDWPRCFGNFKDDISITNNAVEDYRNYYKIAKRHLIKYTRREIPFWYV
jgi:hypothetical protein